MLPLVLLALSQMAWAAKDCSLRTTHESCLYEADNCVWSELYMFCHNNDSNANIQCARIYEKEDCLRYGCEFDNSLQLCHGQGSPYPCFSLSDPLDCINIERCHWTHDGCHEKNRPVDCSKVRDRDYCLTTSHCEWDFSVELCYDREVGLPCESRGKDACSGDATCVYNQDVLKCKKRDDSLTCDMLQKEDVCNRYSKCEWHFAANACARRGKPTPCHRIFMQDACEQQPHCKYVKGASLCLTKQSHVPCMRYHDASACTEDIGCRFDTRINRCLQLNSTIACYDFAFNAQECKAAGCTVLRNVCMPPKMAKKCEEYALPRECIRHFCSWSASSMCHDPVVDYLPPPKLPLPGEVPGVHALVQGVVQGVVGSTCKDVQCDDDIVSKCKSDEHSGTHSKECCARCSSSQQYCSQFNNQALCPETCEYHGLLNACTSLGNHPACELYRGSFICNTIPGCSWTEPTLSCSDQGKLANCYYFDVSVSCERHAHCRFDTDLQVCVNKDNSKPTPCQFFKTPSVCSGQSQCEYDQFALRCKEKSEQLPCLSYTSTQACTRQESRCVFHESTQLCLPSNFVVPCPAFKSAAACPKASCDWDSMTLRCLKHVSYEPIPCDLHIVQQACEQEVGCKWWKDSHLCTEEDKKPDCHRLSTASQCAINPACKYIGPARLCLPRDNAVPCERYVSVHDCSTDVDCTWHPTLFGCISSHLPIPCDRVRSSTICKTTEACEYSELLNACFPKGSQPLCAAASNQTQCSAINGCRWLEGQHSCLDQKITACRAFVVKSECSKMPNCIWHPNAHSCLESNEVLKCHDIFQEHGCRATKHCRWDSRHMRCRRHREEL